MRHKKKTYPGKKEKEIQLDLALKERLLSSPGSAELALVVRSGDNDRSTFHLTSFFITNLLQSLLAECRLLFPLPVGITLAVYLTWSLRKESLGKVNISLLRLPNPMPTGNMGSDRRRVGSALDISGTSYMLFGTEAE